MNLPNLPNFAPKLAGVIAVVTVPVAIGARAVGDIHRLVMSGEGTRRTIRIGHARIAELRDPKNAQGPVTVAGMFGWYAWGIPGSFVAGLATSVGCALCSRMVPDDHDERVGRMREMRDEAA